MSGCYIELRKSAARGKDSPTADIMRHLRTRQHLGKALILCEQPMVSLSAARKQWLKLTRAVQRQRSCTLNADKILKYTHTIAHMQRLRFTTKPPLDEPGSDVYFLTPQLAAVLPAQCWTVYALCEPPLELARRISEQLPDKALVVDYGRGVPWREPIGLRPKRLLEAQVDSQWRQVRHFLHRNGIAIDKLVDDDIRNIDAMDDALDTLLGISHHFLEIANEFQRALELARPLKIDKTRRIEYDSLALLAHRVQTLLPGAFNQRFLEAYSEDDTFYLHDASRGRYLAPGESLADAYERHIHAGRERLARALQEVYGNSKD
ncbi:MAG TPA: hypothetical protein VLF91_06555 [Candidatus Saccharimonadales bacterium]|nr:hypothetical protein [Candidatus Saccharimonadales bacterium]